MSTGSWVPGADGSGYALSNLPYGVTVGEIPRVVAAIGDYALDLSASAQAGLLDGLGAPREVWAQPRLNDFIDLGPTVHRKVRRRLKSLLGTGARHRRRVEACLLERSKLVLGLPVAPRDFTDFYASEHHAVRSMRVANPEAVLGENWRSMPLGYHSRASAFLGTQATIRRPQGLRRTKDGPQYEQSRSVDFELEAGFVLALGTGFGAQTRPDQFPQRVFGFALLNDWSARDIQAWEAQPLGPYQSKSFATQLGPWVTPVEVLAECGTVNQNQSSAALHLRHAHPFTFDVELEAAISTAKMRARAIDPQVVCRTNLKHMYWDPAQQLSQLTANGAPSRSCDVYGTGTVSGPDPSSSGCLLELTEGGREPLLLPTGEKRGWLEDGDEVVLTGRVRRSGEVIADLGELVGRLRAPQKSHLEGRR
ncbi:MAG: fumarylacetoacetate hydrolase family protein [Phenylobacterium sp.]|uniref:fumarylacetoacetate hydrolase family protein n=1 Tax=Phenylobacterium sp. TaxID=1871053 RepID=UPI00391C1F24